MKTTTLILGEKTLELHLPDQTEIFSMSTPEPLADPATAINEALNHSVGSPGLDQLIQAKLKIKPDLKAVIVVSDYTRPAPYHGDQGILWPVVERLLKQGVPKERILILIATGTHRAMTNEELHRMLDHRIFEMDIPVSNHDCHDQDNLIYLGETTRGSRVFINRQYMEADLKILTGLVESHFMAGVSGGRKSICPGLIGEASTYVFHSASMLASPLSGDLILEGNPCHDEALEVAKMAGADYILNVTLDRSFRITGVFAGELEKAHLKAVERLKEYVAFPVKREYDLVVTHAGFVGINHYQAAKAAVASIPVLKKGGWLIEVADNTDSKTIGSLNYRTVLHLLKLFGPERFNQLILSSDWTFIPEQWQVQMWAKVFLKVPMEHYIYYSPQLSEEDFKVIPGIDGNRFLPAKEAYQGRLGSAVSVIESAIAEIIRIQGNKDISIAFLADGPYAIPCRL